MKDHVKWKFLQSGRSVAVYACYLLVVVMLMSSLTLSKYVSTGEGSSASARVALLVEGETTVDFAVDAAGSYPGGTWMVPAAISNYDGVDVSEVTMQYEVSVENVTGNLPLTFSLYLDAEGKNPAGEEDLVFAAGIPQEKTVYIGVHWPAEKNDAALSGEMDILQATVKAEQAD